MRKIAAFWVMLIALWGLSGTAAALCTKVPKANVRSGPGTAYSIVWEVYKYMPFEKVGSSNSGTWYAVKDIDGDVSWMHKNLLTASYRCAVVGDTEANVRTGPGTQYKETSWSPARQYASFRVLQKKGNWLKIRDEWNSTGWIHKSLLWVR